MNYNISKVGVPCQTPPFMVNLSVPHPPAFSYANSTHLSSNLTMVTGYINLGKFKKGEADLFYTNDMYKGWMRRLAKIRNFMVIFVEENITDAIFREARSYLPSSFTKIIHIKRNDLWGFKLENSIKNIYDAPCYPKFHPNTVMASYSCVMQSKYDMMGMAVQKNYFQTKYFSWVDIGCFRDQPENGPPFSLGLPKKFNEERVAYTEVYSRRTNVNCQDIVFNNLVWVGGPYFVGRGDVMLAWVTQYQSYVYNMLHSGLMSTDQQVIYCMFNARPQPSSVKIQVYKAQEEHHDWFTLGYLSKRNR
ncbi:uncharacterized protein LOC116303612 [Actinia tenebrosa]|uniref:Uncharacterized protein LOC116303612 n=1 Tax=Actinia tenebrosa TaxID=6105 RepID=A0A6P8IQ60_ACTTE|nr:uncharacterized protein LOC116303612 [Actinia tenebrosa]